MASKLQACGYGQEMWQELRVYDDIVQELGGLRLGDVTTLEDEMST